MFDEGINRLGEVLDLGVETNFLKRSGTWISYGETRLGQGREKARDFLKENPTLAKEIEESLVASVLKRTAAVLAGNSSPPSGATTTSDLGCTRRGNRQAGRDPSGRAASGHAAGAAAAVELVTVGTVMTTS
jgi:hypothetical protein